MMTTDGFRVTSGALRTLGDTLAHLAQQLDAIHQNLATVHVAPSAFGALPASGQLLAEYTAHAQAELDDLLAARALAEDSGSGLSANATVYDEAGQHVAADIRAIQRTL